MTPQSADCALYSKDNDVLDKEHWSLWKGMLLFNFTSYNGMELQFLTKSHSLEKLPGWDKCDHNNNLGHTILGFSIDIEVSRLAIGVQ